MKSIATILVVTLVSLAAARAEYVVLSSSFNQEEQENRLETFRKKLSAYGEPTLRRASNGAVTVAIPCKSGDEAKSLRTLLISRELAPKDTYIVADAKLGPMDAKAASRSFIQVAARRDREAAVELAEELFYNEHWNGEVQVWATDADKEGKRWFRVVIPGKNQEQITALQKYLKAENVIDKSAFVIAESDLGLQVFSTHEEGV
jgi:hypothetical protein